MENDIIITQWATDDKYAFSPNTVKEDIKLSNAILDYYNEVLEPLNIKLIEQRFNVLITEAGIYGAFYEKDLKHA